MRTSSEMREEDCNNDGEAEGNIRVYAKMITWILPVCLTEHFQKKRMQIAIDRMHADNVGVKVGDQRFLSAGRGSKLSD